MIRVYPDPILSEPAKLVPVTPANAIAELVDDVGVRLLREAQKAGARGLAAPQIGESVRLVVFNAGDAAVARWRFLVNPEVVEHGRQTEIELEGCLSLPGLCIPIERPRVVTVLSFDPSVGQSTLETLKGRNARTVQHEIDHLDGKTILDRASEGTRREYLEGKETR